MGGVITSLSEFVALNQLHRLGWAKRVDVLAINIRDAEVEQMETKPKFFTLKFSIIDPSCVNGDGVTITLTRPYKEALPKNIKPGDILLLRNMQIKSKDNQRSGFSTLNSGWKIWRPKRSLNGMQEMVAVPIEEAPYAEYGVEEEAYVNKLWEWWKGIDVDVRVFLINRREIEEDIGQENA
ncbi:hypothetical protein ABW20_dc0105013 [Dactylellina cionopaga]|nr:hypothetical protein ABW20_dc0105013 [Dactylellina cionopaga]